MPAGLLALLIAQALPHAVRGGAADSSRSAVFRDVRQVLPREPVAPGELRVSVMGSGMPYTRRAQAAASLLVELGDEAQTVFLFDLGSGSMANVNAAGVDYSRLNTVFLTHYHVDHTGDLPALFGAGMVMGRVRPLQLYGPSGRVPEHGLEHLCRGLRAFTQWDIDSRKGRVPSGSSDQLVCHEFDYAMTNQTVYAEGDVVVTASPVVHAIDGPVAYRLSWRGRSFTFSGDTKPSSNMVELARDSDIFVHEAFVQPRVLAQAMNLGLDNAKHIVEHIHTPLHAAGRIFALAKPRLAVAYHLWLQHEDLPEIIDEVRRTYAGPLAIADDLDVYEAFEGGVRQRKRLLVERPFPIPSRGASSHTAEVEACAGKDAGHSCSAAPNLASEQRLGLSDFLLNTVIPIE